MMLWFKKLICRWRGHNLELFDACSKCIRCGKVQMSRAQLLKDLLPALNLLLEREYDEYKAFNQKEKST